MSRLGRTGTQSLPLFGRTEATSGRLVGCNYYVDVLCTSPFILNFPLVSMGGLRHSSCEPTLSSGALSQSENCLPRMRCGRRFWCQKWACSNNKNQMSSCTPIFEGAFCSEMNFMYYIAFCSIAASWQSWMSGPFSSFRSHRHFVVECPCTGFIARKMVHSLICTMLYCAMFLGFGRGPPSTSSQKSWWRLH